MEFLVVVPLILAIIVGSTASLTAKDLEFLCLVFESKLPGVVCPTVNQIIQKMAERKDNTEFKGKYVRKHKNPKETVIYLPIKEPVKFGSGGELTDKWFTAALIRAIDVPIKQGWFNGVTRVGISVAYFDVDLTEKIKFERSSDVSTGSMFIQFILLAWNEILTMKLTQEELTRIRENALKLHNEKRKLHGCPGLELDEELSEDAQVFAEGLAAGIIPFESTDPSKYSANIYRFTRYDLKITADPAVDGWYGEMEQFSFDNSEQKTHCRQFTAMIWRSSTKMGFGVAVNPCFEKDSDKILYDIFVVARYEKAGNIDGRYAENVPKKLLNFLQWLLK